MGLYEMQLMGQPWGFRPDPADDYDFNEVDDTAPMQFKFLDGSTFIYNGEYDYDTRRDGRISDYSIADMVYDKAGEENLTKAEILAYIEKVKNLESHEAID